MAFKRFEQVQDLFRLARNERQGFTVLAVLCTLLATWIFYEHQLRPHTPIPRIKVENLPSVGAGNDLKTEVNEPEAFELKAFDPNTLDSVGWLGLGFSPKQAASILKYRRKGGSFRIKKDLSKMYVVDDGKYKELEAFIQLPDKYPKPNRDFETTEKKNYNTKNYRVAENKPKVKVELNSADTDQLEALPFIGPKTASQIISFRDLLGGFHSSAQLADVYYLRDKPEAVKELLELVEVDPTVVRRIAVNECEAATLADHPFIGWKEANALVNYRNHHGEFAQLEDIKGCKLITEELFRKIAPYLTVE